MENGDTVQFSIPKENSTLRSVLTTVYDALAEKGYDPIDQMVGYLMSGDPTYITGYRNARYLLSRINRDELIEELLRGYLEGGLRK